MSNLISYRFSLDLRLFGQPAQFFRILIVPRVEHEYENSNFLVGLMLHARLL